MVSRLALVCRCGRVALPPLLDGNGQQGFHDFLSILNRLSLNIFSLSEQKYFMFDTAALGNRSFNFVVGHRLDNLFVSGVII
jgi:hypothetical protein